MSNIYYDAGENAYSFECPHCCMMCFVKKEDIYLDMPYLKIKWSLYLHMHQRRNVIGG